MLSNKAVYACKIHEAHKVIALLDEFHPDRPTRTVTNDAEGVVAEIAAMFPGMFDQGWRLIYCDTSGDWDEILIRDSKFDGFACLNAKTCEQALAKISQTT